MKVTYFMAYFELKNKNSENYSDFADVGNFLVPDEIYGGSINVDHDGKKIKSSIITDLSGQGANNFFLRRGEKERGVLMDFITQRINNKCVISCIVGYIDIGQDIIFPEKHEKIDMSSLQGFFSEDPSVGVCLEITS